MSTNTPAPAKCRYPTLLGLLSRALDAAGDYIVLDTATYEAKWMQISSPLLSLDEDVIRLCTSTWQVVVPLRAELLCREVDGSFFLCCADAIRPGMQLVRSVSYPGRPTTLWVATVDDDIVEACRCGRVLRRTVALTENVGWFHGASSGNGAIVHSYGVPKSVLLCDPSFKTRLFWSSILPAFYEGEAPCVRITQKYVDRFGKLQTSAQVSDSKLAATLERAFGRRSIDRHLPYLFGTPEEYRWGLLAGLMDTDGYIPRRTRDGCPNVTFTTASTALAIHAYMLLCSLGYNPYLAEQTRSASAHDVEHGWPATHRTFAVHVRVSDFVGKWPLSLHKPARAKRQELLFEARSDILARQTESTKVRDYQIHDVKYVDRVARPKDYLWPHLATRHPFRTVSGFWVHVRG